jgi:large subunit ribosomal protein L5
MSETTQTEKPKAASPRLEQKYRQEVLPLLQERLGLDNPLAAPRVDKVVLSMGVGMAKKDQKHLEDAQIVLSSISGQKPVVTLARKSIANFQLRAGQPIGCMVTIRRHRMYEFLDRLIGVVLPRVRDFQGLSPNSFDGHGNYSLGIQEHIVFPEADPDAVSMIYGLNVTICTTAGSDPAALELLRLLGMPFRK